MADIKIAGKLVAGASDGVLAGADAVKDASLGKFQEAVNRDALGNGVFNVTSWTNQSYASVTAAAVGVPSALRRLGMVITFLDTGGEWIAKQFTGDDVTDWTDDGSWDDFGGGGGADFVPVTSEEVAGMQDP